MQPPNDDNREMPAAEIIRPLSVKRNGCRDGDRPTRRSLPFLGLVFIGIVIALAGAGFWLFGHLAKNPLVVSNPPDAAVPAQPESTSDQIIAPSPPLSSADTVPGEDKDKKGEVDGVLGAFLKDKSELATKNIDDVKRLVASGKDHEEANNATAAYKDYEQALAIDPDFKEAAAGIERIKQQVANRKFHQLMSEGLTALGKSDYSTARAKLLQARKIRPGSQAAGDALAQLDQTERLAEIETLRRSALESEASEDWEQALASYLKVIKLDPNLRFARQGKERCLNQGQIAKRIDYFLEHPDTLGHDPQLEKAQALVDEAVGIVPKGPRLTERINRLAARVKAAKTTVRVTIQSDNFTEVAVYRVGKLGRFSVRDLDLRPGSYTVVGSRDGYRDIRQRVTIKPGEKSLQVTVICRIKI